MPLILRRFNITTLTYISSYDPILSTPYMYSYLNTFVKFTNSTKAAPLLLVHIVEKIIYVCSRHCRPKVFLHQIIALHVAFFLTSARFQHNWTRVLNTQSLVTPSHTQTLMHDQRTHELNNKQIQISRVFINKLSNRTCVIELVYYDLGRMHLIWMSTHEYDSWIIQSRVFGNIMFDLLNWKENN